MLECFLIKIWATETPAANNFSAKGGFDIQGVL